MTTQDRAGIAPPGITQNSAAASADASSQSAIDAGAISARLDRLPATRLFLGLFIGTIACGFLADRFGRRAIFTYSLLWYTVANVIMAFQDTATGLNFWRFMAGFGIGVELVTIGTYISELVPKPTAAVVLVCLGVGLTPGSNIMSYSYYAYQAELFPTSIRARAVGFVY
jgi:putative MFS transporter